LGWEAGESEEGEKGRYLGWWSEWENERRNGKENKTFWPGRVEKSNISGEFYSKRDYLVKVRRVAGSL
jgi:hypothetical protein